MKVFDKSKNIPIVVSFFSTAVLVLSTNRAIAINVECLGEIQAGFFFFFFFFCIKYFVSMDVVNTIYQIEALQEFSKNMVKVTLDYNLKINQH